MKKILALTLAAVMTAGMTTVAFADGMTPVFTKNGDEQYLIIDANDDGTFTVSTDKDKDETNLSVAEGGMKVALLLYDEATGDNVTDKDDVERYKVTADWEVSKPDAKPVIERVKIDNHGKRLYAYAVTFVLPESPETKTGDLLGDVTIYKTTSDKKNPYNTFSVNLSYGYDNVWKVDTDGEDLPEDVTVVDFDDVEEAYLTFGEDFEFEVDVTGQGKLNLKNNRDFDPEFADWYDYANIDFITFEYEPSFNKIGRVYIYADEDAFIYKKGAEGAEKINGLEWDEDMEAWTFKTRKLESYVISDVELDEKTVTEDKDDSSSTTDSGKTNPDTGR